MAELRCLLLPARDLELVTMQQWRTIEEVRRPAAYLLWRLLRSMGP